MTELKGSRFSDSMPDNLASQPEVQALAYAVGRQVEKLCDYADNARTYAAIAAVPERVLDYLAVELRTPSYDESYPVDTKRELIQDTILFYAQMGTPAAVERIIKTIFGSGSIEEWFDYGGQPHHFRVVSGNMNAISENYGVFLRVLESVKRKSSWLDSITAVMGKQINVYTGAAIRVGKRRKMQTNAVDIDSFVPLCDEDDLLVVDEVGRTILDG